jgi:predicted transcriptional regulator
MKLDPIPAVVRQLLRDHIESYEHLECLLLLGRTHPRSWAVDEVASELHSGPSIVAEALEHLHRAGLVQTSTTGGPQQFTYTAGPDLIETLWHAYATNRLEIMSLMTANSLDRVSTSALRRFASAFFLRRKNDG